jgi:ribosomal protein S18 acetylase RimI-like enzyme
MTAIRVVSATEESRLAEIGELTALAYLADGILDRADPYVPRLRDAKVRAEQAILLMAAGGARGEGAAMGTLTVVPPQSPFAEFPDRVDFELRMLAVSPLARGRGIGEDLARFGLAMAVERGARRVLLSTMEAMTAAHRLYEKAGFERLPGLDWVAHQEPEKRECDASCRAADGSCSVGGTSLRVYVWEPPAA